MNNQFMWHDRYNIGVDIIDREHKKLFSIMNKLLAYGENETKSEWVCREGIKYFKEHAMKHFSEEEVYMASIGYSGFEMHRRLHDSFRKKTLPEIEKELEQTGYSPDAVKHFLGVCAGWLMGHTMTEDRAITGKVISKWVDLLPEEEQSAMKQVVTQLLYDLFRLESRLISDNYSGEKFGKGIYYRLVYGAQNGKKWEFILIFEEKLLVSTMGSVIGSKSEKLNVMMVNATRYTAQQFLERIQLHFPTDEVMEIQEENLLTYEQFQRIFAKNHPQFSFLFDTGKGYFAYCVMAPHLLQGSAGTGIKADTESVGPAIHADNATAEIRRYLKSNVAVKKKQVLVVDDSNIVLQAMKQLLGGDYDVVLANSGLSAIRSMILHRPDLVLLDYEMPVCNGMQVLEMIRSEADLADIPVIFLSGTVDRERINKARPLKPEGYLLKMMKPDELKEKIDDFFHEKTA